MREQLQYICFMSILIDHKITYDAIYDKDTFAEFPLFLMAGRAVTPP